MTDPVFVLFLFHFVLIFYFFVLCGAWSVHVYNAFSIFNVSDFQLLATVSYKDKLYIFCQFDKLTKINIIYQKKKKKTEIDIKNDW